MHRLRAMWPVYPALLVLGLMLTDLAIILFQL